LTVDGIGTAAYTFLTATGEQTTITLPNTLYIPRCTACLLCPRHLAAPTGHPDDGFTSLQHTATLTCNGTTIPVVYDPQTKLPFLHTITANTSEMCDYTANNAVISSGPPVIHPNLTNAQCIKLLCHERLNHRNMETVSRWIRAGLLPVDPSVASCPNPICASCQMGKAHQKPHAKTTNSIAAPCQNPGEGVSADQLEAGCPGRIPTTKGLPTAKRYRYCNFWIDHYSKFIFPTFHETKAAAELIASKQAFQDFAARYQIKIKKIRADNGVYSSDPFQVSCAEHQQDLSFCAVGGHWQNGVAECFIGVITQMARTILLHAVTQWPSVLSEEFWPYAIRHACAFHNSSINPDTNKSPHHMFTGSPAPWRMKDFRVFGCPVFVLDKRLQDGDSLPKWKSRCWTGVYVGQSLHHAGNVPLIYNPAMTHVTPQYHLTFDDQFTTVTGVTPKLSDAD